VIRSSASAICGLGLSPERRNTARTSVTVPNAPDWSISQMVQ